MILPFHLYIAHKARFKFLICVSNKHSYSKPDCVFHLAITWPHLKYPLAHKETAVLSLKYVIITYIYYDGVN